MRLRQGWLLAGICALALSAGTAHAATEIRVVVAHYSDATAPIFEGMAKDFEHAHPDVKIRVEDVSWDNLQQRLTTDIAGGTPPDLAIVGTRWLLDYASQDVAEPLDSYMTQEFKDRFIGDFLKPSVINGKTYGLPVAASVRSMFYNKDLLAKAGVNGPPATWDDFLAAAKSVKAKSGGAYAFGLQGKELETDVYWYYALWTMGGNLIENGKSGIASPAGIKAATLYKELIDEGLTQPEPTGANRQDVESLFKQGRAAMIFTGPYMRGQIAKEAPTLNYGIAPIPKGTTAATYGVTDSIVLFKDSSHKDVAWKFLEEQAFSPKWRTEFTLKEGFLPITKAEAADPTFANDPGLKALTALLPSARFAPLIPNWEEMADATMAALQQIYLGDAKPEDALKSAADKIDGLIKP
ncbi:carbohydrate ABC transporter substrate-binding protein, CUT1 family [Arboricoccus pini]|uniref:Carbohydrate ABC transporter substrate-binding protein, CUT1 family n=1 Tax=Arboricoccus pini TaxID=1963835 RepID=A0A212R509_9PROT|nr:sugar ABC transporter substrate-binding protein [Arboricoccus pini]SNB67135.1 carbohydrate ABC transporter substrate-binding protein, CUT1 family [Arboricoccus pini]